MPLNIFGRPRPCTAADSSDTESPTKKSPLEKALLLEELRSAVSRIDCIVEQCNIAWSVESGSYLNGESDDKILSVSSKSRSKKDGSLSSRKRVCRLMQFEASDEIEIIELLRRVAEVVVLGEQNNSEIDSDQIFQYFYEENVLGKSLTL